MYTWKLCFLSSSQYTHGWLLGLHNTLSCVLIIVFHILLYYTAPTEVPVNVSVSVQSSSNITLSWKPPSLKEQNGVIIRYHVIVMEVQILNVDNGTVISQTGKNFSRTYDASQNYMQSIDMLHPNYNYTVRIAAATAVGIGPFSDPITVMTLEDGECIKFV